MKLRNFANKFLLITVLVLFAFVNFTQSAVSVGLVLTPADEPSLTPLTKTYCFDQKNINKPSSPDETIYEALGIKDYNEYLMELSATQSLKEVVVAVIDTGVDVNASCGVFADRVLTEYAMDFSYGLPTPANQWSLDENGHGTHVAGIIADITLSNVKILPLKIFHGLDNAGSGSAFENALRYLYALKRGVTLPLLRQNGTDGYGNPVYVESNVYCNEERRTVNIVAVNLSLGTPGRGIGSQTYKEEKPIYQNVIDQYLWDDKGNGILPIAAAGNRGSNDYVKNTQGEYLPYYSLPGACDRVLTVSAYENTDSQYKLASYSYYNDYVSVAAPGTSIWSACTNSFVEKLSVAQKVDDQPEYNYEYEYTTSTGKTKTARWYIKKVGDVYYYRNKGTSMATPFVTACYAMLMSDPSKVTVADYGLAKWNPESQEEDGDVRFLNMAHKAICAAAATDGVGVGGRSGYDIRFGYGTVTVVSFVPKAGQTTIEPLEDIKYEPQNQSNYDPSMFDVADDTVDWVMVCIILALVIVFIWVIKTFKSYYSAVAKKGETNDDEQ